MSINSKLFTRLQHLLPALLLALTGLGVLIGGSHYQTGSLTQMGPGYMPALLGTLLMLLALAVFVFELRTQVAVSKLPLRPLLCAGGSIVVWALLADTTGFVPACIVQLLLAFAALPQSSWKGVLLHSVVITILAYVMFVILLGIPMQALGW